MYSRKGFSISISRRIQGLLELERCELTWSLIICSFVKSTGNSLQQFWKVAFSMGVNLSYIQVFDRVA